MNKIISLLLSLTFLSISTSAEEICFLAVENGKALKEEGDCKKRYAPESTFKIALSLMGFDSGIFSEIKTPNWTCPSEKRNIYQCM